MGVNEGESSTSSKGFSLNELLSSVTKSRRTEEAGEPSGGPESKSTKNSSDSAKENPSRLAEILDLGNPQAGFQDHRTDDAQRPNDPENAPGDAEVEDWEMLSPLPRASDPYKAYSRIKSRPVTTIFFLDRTMLPNGYANSGFERVYFEEGGSSGEGPVLVVRFYGSVVTEVRIEGRNLIPLATHIGRQLVQWVRERPQGIAEESEAMTIVTRITTVVNPFEED